MRSSVIRTFNMMGRVQSREYQLYLLKVRSDERMAKLRGLKVEVKSIEQIQKEYEEKYGTRFINI